MGCGVWGVGRGVLLICILRFPPNESDVGGLHHGEISSQLEIQYLNWISTLTFCVLCTFFQTAYKQASTAYKEIEEVWLNTLPNIYHQLVV